MRKTTSVMTAVAVLAALLVLPSSAWSQACLANAASGGQGFISAGPSFTSGAWALGGAAGYNVPGPISVEANVDHTMVNDSDATATALGARAALQMQGLPLSVCPVASIRHQWFSDDGLEDLSMNRLVLGGGLSLGHTVAQNGSLALTPHLQAGVVHDRLRISDDIGSFSDSETYGAFTGGVLLSAGSLYGGPAVSLSTLEGSNPVYSLGVGFVLGPRLR